ncbi:unnamed protein product [Heligmosomoides polygyrus]|uniref:RING-type E3 ubiquitin transferase n=1 Tax=Heligmosomoides polygyrus TaxID=6339 RepID=A0A183FX23_HELPZ|nr:unnamed protein product [Heligmosomoides polygyrus]
MKDSSAAEVFDKGRLRIHSYFYNTRGQDMGNEMKWLTASPGPGRPVAPARVVPYCAGCQFTSDALVTASGDLLKRAIWNKVYEQPHRSGSPRTRHAPRLDSRRTRPLRSSSEWLTLAGNARGREGLGAHDGEPSSGSADVGGASADGE